MTRPTKERIERIRELNKDDHENNFQCQELLAEIAALRMSQMEISLLCELAGYESYTLTSQHSMRLSILKVTGITEKKKNILQEIINLRISGYFKIIVEIE